MRLTILLLFVFTCTTLTGQLYEFSERKEAYTPLSNADTVVFEIWSDSLYSIELPFEFNFYGYEWDLIQLQQGRLKFSRTNSDTTGNISAFLINLVSSDVTFEESPILSKVEGPMGDRIFKIEWKNAHFDALEGFFDYVNFQIWLYEKANKVEFHYGESITELAIVAYEEMNMTFGGQVGLGIGDTNELNGTYVVGDLENKMIVNSKDLLLEFPLDSTVYVFEQMSTSILEENKNSAIDLIIAPSPSTDRIVFGNLDQETSIRILHSNGSWTTPRIIVDNRSSLSISSWPTGVYFVIDYSGHKIGSFVKI